MLRKIGVGLLVMLLLGLTVSAYAEENAGSKLGRGIVNDLTFPLEVPKQIYLTSKEDHLLSGLTFGLVKGICHGILRLASGAYDTVTFLIPRYEKVLMEPKFVSEDWE